LSEPWMFEGLCVRNFLLCDRRRRVAIAFWISLFWVAFLI